MVNAGTSKRRPDTSRGRSELTTVSTGTSAIAKLLNVASNLFEAIDTPVSLKAALLLKYREYAQLVDMNVDPMDYTNAYRFADDYFAAKFLSKYECFKHEDLNPEQKALDSFYAYEEMCTSTNKKFRELDLDPSKWDPMMHSILLSARRKIRRVLGVLDLDEVFKHMGWGPGATSSTPALSPSAYVKFTKELHVTSNCFLLGKACVNSIPAWVNCQLQSEQFPSTPLHLTDAAFDIVRGNKIVFQPKNAKTHRVIAVEPHVNSFLQKGFGGVIRKRLRVNAGVNLKDQTINQRLARSGSIDGQLATIDLSGASDTVSTEVVKFLLPSDWYGALSRVRSSQGYVSQDKTWIKYEKFSSMGNGSTFELESLLFWALCKATLEATCDNHFCNVYGDDIVIPSAAYKEVANVLTFVGFSLNDNKSFSSGPFRESCGRDYFEGFDVRPIFQKKEITNVESILKLANRIRRYAHSRGLGLGCDRRFRGSWLGVLDYLPPDVRNLKIPCTFGDEVGVVSNFDEAVPRLARYSEKRAGWEGYLFKGLQRNAVKRLMWDEHAAYTVLLSVNGDSQMDERCEAPEQLLRDSCRPRDVKSPLDGCFTRKDDTYLTVAQYHTSDWCDLGPWC